MRCSEERPIVVEMEAGFGPGDDRCPSPASYHPNLAAPQAPLAQPIYWSPEHHAPRKEVAAHV